MENEITTRGYKKLLSRFSKDALLDIRNIAYYLLEDYFTSSLELNKNEVSSKIFSLILDNASMPRQRIKSIFEKMIYGWYVFEPIQQEDLAWLNKGGINVPDSFKKKYKIHTNNLKSIIQATEELTGEVPLFESGRSGYATLEEKAGRTYLLIEVGKEKRPFCAGKISSKTDKLLRVLVEPYLGCSKNVQFVAQEVGIKVNSFNQDWKDIEIQLRQKCKELQRTLKNNGFPDSIRLRFENKIVKMVVESR